jgi:hypothetical protein
VGTSDSLLPLSAAGSALAGSFIQIEAEVIRVEEVQNNGNRQYRVTRGATAARRRHARSSNRGLPTGEQDGRRRSLPDFFGSPYSGS